MRKILLILALIVISFGYGQEDAVAPKYDLTRPNPKTTAQIQSMTRMVEGSEAWNTDTSTIWRYVSSTWVDTGIGGGGADGVGTARDLGPITVVDQDNVTIDNEAITAANLEQINQYEIFSRVAASQGAVSKQPLATVLAALFPDLDTDDTDDFDGAYGSLSGAPWTLSGGWWNSTADFYSEGGFKVAAPATFPLNDPRASIDVVDNGGSLYGIMVVDGPGGGISTSSRITADPASYNIIGGMGNDTYIGDISGQAAAPPSETAHVIGNVLADGYKIPSGTSDDVLIGDGSTTSLAGIGGSDNSLSETDQSITANRNVTLDQTTGRTLDLEFTVNPMLRMVAGATFQDNVLTLGNLSQGLTFSVNNGWNFTSPFAVYKSSSAPTHAVARLWYDTNNDELNISDGTIWILLNGGGSANIEDDAFGAGWNGDTTNGASQNSLYDYIIGLTKNTISGRTGTAVDAVMIQTEAQIATDGDPDTDEIVFCSDCAPMDLDDNTTVTADGYIGFDDRTSDTATYTFSGLTVGSVVVIEMDRASAPALSGITPSNSGWADDFAANTEQTFTLVVLPSGRGFIKLQTIE